MYITHLHLSGFKSIEELDLRQLSAYSAFAGPNGAGKSNLFDALCFVSAIQKVGAAEAIRQFGGYESIHCYKKRGKGARTFSFKVVIELNDITWKYHLTVLDMDSEPRLSESLYQNDDAIVVRSEGGLPQFGLGGAGKEIPKFPPDRSILLFAFDAPIVPWLMNINVYRIDPLGAKEPDASNVDSHQLHKHGHNVATMLTKLKENEEFRDTILEWMELIAPGLKGVSTEKQKLDGRTVLTFQEDSVRAQFPANLVSDGTIYVLCILTAVLSRTNDIGLTLIEEPERGINPKAIAEIVSLIRDKASNQHPIWVTTHSESVVRSSQADELLFLNKHDGRTVCTYGRDAHSAVTGMTLDKAWLSNIFGGGLPW